MLKRLCCGVLVIAVSGSAGTAQPAIGVPRDPAAPGYLDLSKRHPDGLEGPDEFARGFTADAALQRLEQIREFLTSFRLLTDGARAQLPSELKKAGNTDRAMQTIGFHNIPLVIEGTLRKQEYQLAQAHYELAQLRHTQGVVSDGGLAQARSAYVEAARRFQMFWDTKRPTD